MGFYAILDGVTVVLYKVMQTYNIMDSIPAEEVRLKTIIWKTFLLLNI